VSLIFSVIAVSSIAATRLLAQQDHDHHGADHHGADHHGEGPVHFSHPIFTESPSPDTKLRIDYLHASVAHDVADHELRVEGEYAFSHSISIEANLPLTSRSHNGVRTTAVGSGEIALKLANFAAARHGLLLGGGLAFGLPAWNDNSDIASDHIVEVEPYLDAGYMRGRTEIVSFLSYSVAAHRTDADEEEQEIAVAASLLYHLDPRIESLIEVETRRSIAGEESGSQIVNGAVGLKYRFPALPSLIVGAGARIPLTHDREFRSEMTVSLFYHFQD
jgi:hypothetical protein